MPLTPAEQAELESINQQLAEPTAGGLTPEEQAELESVNQQLAIQDGIRSEAQAQLEESYPRQLARGAIETLPYVGSVLGGAAGTALGAPTGPGVIGAGMVGAGLGGAAGLAAEQGLKGMFFPGEGPQGGVQQTADLATEAVISATGEKILEPVGKALSGAFKYLSRATKTGQKAIAPAVIEAAERLGIKPTQGMLSDSPIIRGLESSLQQSPSLAGAAVRAETEAVHKGLQATAGKFDVVQDVLSKFETGEALKTGITGKVGERVGQAQILYDTLEDKFKDVAVKDRIKKILVTKIKKLPGAAVAIESPSAGLAKRVNNEIANIKNLESARFLRTEYRKQLSEARRAGRSAEADILSEAYDGLTRLRNDSIKTKVFANNQQREALLGTIKEADKIYADFAKDGREIAKSLKFKYTTPNDLVEAVADIPSEKLAENIFNLSNFKTTAKFKELFPEVFEQAKNSRITQLIEKAKVKGEVNPSKLVRVLDGVQPEARKLLFGDAADQMYKDLKTVTQAIPEKMGPSGTPQGIEFLQMLNPKTQISAAARLGVLRGAEKAPQLFQRLSNTAPNPLMQRLLGQGVVRAGGR